jgi:hypothetical protein
MDLGRTAVAVTRRLIGPAAIAALLACAAPAAAQGKVTPLFAADAPIDVTIDGPIRAITRQKERSTDPHPATLSANGETLAIELSARGHSRRQGGYCDFPPLRVEFTAKPGDGSLFDGQKKLKLVAHCKDGAGYEQMLLREYAVYRLYNLLTPESFKVRLAKVHYLDGGKRVAETWGFFVEDTSDMAKRVGLREIEVTELPETAVETNATARYVVFQYMIGNHDWDMTHGPAGSDCCHNSKLIGPTGEARTELTPVPYDFDYSGLVDTPYAVPPEQLRIKTVRTRYYRGRCRYNDQALAAAAAFLAARGSLEAELGRIPDMSAKTRESMTKYLDDFFEEVATPDVARRKMLDTCRN